MKSKNRLVAVLGSLAVLTGTVAPSLADPCGMVPPVTMIESDPIVRVGAQQTYVSYYKGVETIVLRPGFKGNVDEFGMLIPFPSPPALRKVDDNIFPHIAAAIDPPEVQAWVQQRFRRSMSRGAGGMKSSAAPEASADSGGGELRYDEVRVVNQEAVGMYEVAVLAAGSSKALKKWMDKHKFRYPDGMDEVVDEYVDDKWVFVAVKTKVGQKKGVNPHPGMKKADAKLPDGATFTGHVQAMGFRFKTDELVVPMRLSAFNKGKLHNIVYILTDEATRIKKIPKRFVRRQISGKELYENLTGPLPLRVMNGTYADLSQWQKQNLVNQRNAEPHNGLAKQLIAADLLAITTGELSSKVEEKEKQLLAIGERLGLRGTQIDALHAQVLKKAKDRAVRKALKHVKKLTLTVVDGEFDRDVLAKDNLHFAGYKVPKKRNNADSYDARHQGPRPARGGKLYRGKAASLELQDKVEKAVPGWQWGGGFGSTGFGLLLAFAGLMMLRRRTRRSARYTVLVALFAVAAVATTPAFAAKSSIADLIDQLGDKDKVQGAIASLTRLGADAVDPLLDEIVDSEDDVVKGWAIIALSQIGGDAVDEELRKIHESSGYKMLIRTWAAAARIDMAKSADEVMELAPLANSFPALQRPLRLALTGKVGGKKGWRGAEELLKAVTKAPNLAQALNPTIVALGPRPLVQAMIRSSDMQVRQMAAAYLPSVKGDVTKTVIKAYTFRKKAKKVPWHGGPLYVPGVQWSKEDATALVDELIKWHLWAELNDEAEIKKQIHNNLQAWQLVNGAGYKNPGWQEVGTDRWLQIWGEVRGRKHIRKMLKEQGIRWDKRWRKVLLQIDK